MHLIALGLIILCILALVGMGGVSLLSEYYNRKGKPYPWNNWTLDKKKKK
jgi:hypothetical protein